MRKKRMQPSEKEIIRQLTKTRDELAAKSYSYKLITDLAVAYIKAYMPNAAVLNVIKSHEELLDLTLKAIGNKTIINAVEK